MKYLVTVRWMAEAQIEVFAVDADAAETMVEVGGLPWAQAQEGDDGGSTTWDVEPLDEHGGIVPPAAV